MGIAVADTIHLLAHKHRRGMAWAVLLVGAVVCALLAEATHGQVKTWENSKTLWSHAVTANRTCEMVYVKHGVVWG